MASTTALYTGLSGLTANARSLDVIGNNIANANTTAFKSSRMLFGTQFSRTLSQGTAPGTNIGGANPTQIGLGVTIAGTQRDFTTGSLSTTGDQRDMAIDGKGFFIVEKGATSYYTRAGAFRQNAVNDLTAVTGERVKGFGVDANFNLVRGVLRDLNVPTGALTLAQATTQATLSGNLNATGPLPTKGSEFSLPPLTIIGGAVPGIAATLVSIADPANPAQPIIQPGQVIEINGAKKGTSTLPTAKLTVTGATTVQDLLTFINQSLGINTGAGANPDGRTPGASIDAAGQIFIDGNVGSDNALSIAPADIHITTAAGVEISKPFPATQLQAADGESVRTQFVVYDSLGAAVHVTMTMALVAKNNGTGTSWRYFAESPEDTQGGLTVGTGIVNFDHSGNLIAPAPLDLVIDRTNTGAASPLSFSVDLNSTSNRMTALESETSNIASRYQNGAPLGTLQTYAVGADGIISGSFSNGLIRTLGQVAIATFSNPEGLVEVGGNLFAPGTNSGTPVVAAPLELGGGKIVGGSLELSNVELSQEFINLITASTGFSAASRVITTTDQLMQQLLTLGR